MKPAIYKKQPLATTQVETSATQPERGAHKAGRNFGLDLIRATAICLVLVDHYATIAPVCGVLGVELFFVLSGFLIGGILYKSILFKDEFSASDMGRFWLRRWLRTLPNYYLFLGVFTLLAVYRTGLTWHDFWPHLLFLQNITHPPAAFYGVSWSLAVEEWFYLLFPLSFFALYTLIGRSPRIKRPLFLGCALALAAFSVGLRFHAETIDWSARMRLTVIYRFDALMYGVILAVVQAESRFSWNFLRKSMLVGACLVLTSAVVAWSLLRHPGSTAPAAWLLGSIPFGFAWMLPWISHLPPPMWRLPALAVNYVSRVSYSIYLCHLPILFLAMQTAHDTRQGTVGKLLIRGVALVATLVCSGCLYRYLEKPILDLAPKDRYSPSRLSQTA